MGKHPANSHKQRLADMTIEPPAEPPYVPPALDVAQQITTPIDISDQDQLVIRQRFYRGMTVDFAIMQKIYVRGRWVDVARIDCCHSFIHRHQYNQDGVDIYDHRPIIRIPAGEPGWTVVDGGYEPAYNLLLSEWEVNLERWRNGS